MKGPRRLRVILVKPSKYDPSGYVERFRWGFMPNSTLPFLRSMTPGDLQGCRLEVTAIDEYVETNLDYLDLLLKADCPTLLALVGVQSHQFQRALDLAAFAKTRGVEHAVIGGPHPMTCDTTLLQGRGVSFALAEAELIWPAILRDALGGELQPVYGRNQRWQHELDSPVLIPPSREEVRRHLVPMLGIYPARGCPFTCNFCSVIKIAGRRVRSQAIETTLLGLLAAKRAGVKLIMFTSDNFNKYPEAKTLLQAMIDAKVNLPFFVQCDTQIARDEEMFGLLRKAGCWQMFVGIESFDRRILKGARKLQNRPEHYREIVRLCDAYEIIAHFSNIIGFPEQDEGGVLDHLRVLRELRPSVASFYILSPCPGTEQYDDFRSRGLITERNLDRFDATCLVWTHPFLNASKLTELLYRCYHDFYRLPDIVKKTWNHQRNDLPWSIRWMYPGYALFNRFAAYRRIHPMAGGIRRAFLDRVSEYLDFRRRGFGVELVPLPVSLAVPAGELKVNRPASSTPLVMAS